MQTYHGKSVFGGIAIGKIIVFKSNNNEISKKSIDDTELEIARVIDAKNKAIEELQGLYDKALEEVGEDNASIFEVHQMMLEDDDYLDSIKDIITNQKVNAEYAVFLTGEDFAQMFASMDDEYMKARSIDVKDISGQLIDILSGHNNNDCTSSEPGILLAEDLAPSQTIQLDKSKIYSIVTKKGSTNSHTAILARTMGIPAIVSADFDSLEGLDGKEAIVDGNEGVFYVDPDEATLKLMTEKKNEADAFLAALEEEKGKETVTLDGHKLKLYANIGGPEDIPSVLSNDAAGIGLFRSEFLFLGRDNFPTEEEQFLAYKQVAEAMGEKPVIIRTLDIGADKKCDYFQLENEENPAMGLRAIRICLTRPEIFKTQLRALFRASNYGNILIMYPMIISLKEVKEIKAIVEEVKQELKKEGVAFKDVKQGIMIETPAAAVISRDLAKEVDFFSLGTNDLTQYTLAIDRQNQSLDKFYDSHHPAVLALIKMVVENAHAEGIWAGICGELGGDPSLTQEFLAMGVDELSVSAPKILPLRKIVRETNLEQIAKNF